MTNRIPYSLCVCVCVYICAFACAGVSEKKAQANGADESKRSLALHLQCSYFITFTRTVFTHTNVCV